MPCPSTGVPSLLSLLTGELLESTLHTSTEEVAMCPSADILCSHLDPTSGPASSLCSPACQEGEGDDRAGAEVCSTFQSVEGVQEGRCYPVECLQCVINPLFPDEVAKCVKLRVNGKQLSCPQNGQTVWMNPTSGE